MNPAPPLGFSDSVCVRPDALTPDPSPAYRRGVSRLLRIERRATIQFQLAGASEQNWYQGPERLLLVRLGAAKCVNLRVRAAARHSHEDRGERYAGDGR